MEQEESNRKQLPFNNLFLNSAVVNGENKWWMYIFGILAVIFGYFAFQLIIGLVLIFVAKNNGVSLDELRNNPAIASSPDKLGINKNLYLALLMGMFVFAFIGLYRVVVRVHKKAFHTIITAYEKIRFSRVLFAICVWGTLNVTTVLLAYYIVGDTMTIQFNPGNFFL